jgi:hypothetical protein
MGWRGHHPRPGQVLKITDPEVVARVVRRLRAAGFRKLDG